VAKVGRKIAEFTILMLEFCEVLIELCIKAHHVCKHLLHHAHELGFFIWSHEEIARIEERACTTLTGLHEWSRGFV
jgi:hypothetical protein